jgi:outer membrane lipoprotein-sorting protein
MKRLWSYRQILRVASRLGCVLLAFWLVGCAGQRAVLPVPENGFPGEADLEGLIELLNHRYQDLATLKALVKVEAKAPSGKGDFYGVLFFQRPDHLRLQGLDPLGRIAFDLVAKGEEVRIHLPREDRTLNEGIDSFPFFGEEKALLKLADLLEVLGASGGVYLDPTLTPALEKDQAAYILYLFYLQDFHAVLYKKLWLDRIYFRLIKEEIFDPEGQRRMTIFFDHYQKIEDRWRPFKVRAKTKDAYQLSLDYSEMKLNPLLHAEDFSIGEER